METEHVFQVGDEVIIVDKRGFASDVEEGMRCIITVMEDEDGCIELYVPCIDARQWCECKQLAAIDTTPLDDEAVL